MAKKRKTVWPRTRSAFGIPDYIPDGQIDKYIRLKKDERVDTNFHYQVKSMDHIGYIS